MRLPNGYGGVVKLSGKRRKPYAARVTAGWHINENIIRYLPVTCHLRKDVINYDYRQNKRDVL